ncbi:MAG: PepSY-like domain-containing protein [Bacteroidales bacterium]|nr:PepSY-like domain-containing protein [Bacteroidales bacterium]
MKKNFLLTASLLAALSMAACNDNDKKAINFGSLPSAAQSFVKTHFGDKQISVVYHDSGIGDNEYEVLFADGAKVEFTAKGEWDEVADRDSDGVPTAIIPQAIASYVNSSHPNTYIVDINKERRTYEVELNNSIEIVFDKNGNFQRYDD